VPQVLLVALLVLAAGAVAVGVDLLQSVDAVRVEAEPATATGEDPFVPPGADAARGSPAAPPSVAGGSNPADGPARPPADVPVSGDTLGLYGGTGAEACDSGGLASYLEAHPATAVTWAGAQGIQREDIRPFLVSLTPVVLRADTAVTNHGHRDGRARAFQSVLQAGTAVLVDDRGVPRVRCSCGNPLDDPAPRSRARYEGQTWPELESRPVTVVRPAPAVVEDFVVVRQTQDGTEAVQRPQGSSGDEDGPTDPETVQVALDFSPEAAADRTDQESHAPTPGSETGTGSPASATPATTGPDDGSAVDQDTTPAGSSTEGSPAGSSTEGSPSAAGTEGSPSAAGTTPATSTTPDASPEGSPSAASPTPAASTTRDQGPTGQGRHPSDGTTLDGTVPDGSAPPG
jgi:hypothetical protein